MDNKARTTYLDSLRSGIEELIKDDPKVYLLGEDICDPYGGAFKITKGLSTKYPDKLINTPMSELGFTGLGVGMALDGLKPIVEIMFGDFVGIILDQVLNHASKFVEGFNRKINLVIRTPMGGYRGYGATHSQSLEKLYLGLPNIAVISPSILHSPGELLKHSVEIGLPVLFIENKSDYTRKLFSFEKAAEYFDIKYIGYPFPVCEVNLKNETPLCTIISYGGMISPILKLIHELYYEEEVPIRLLAFSSLSPVDFESIVNMTLIDERIITIEEGHIPFGFGDGLISNLCQKGLKARFKSFGAKNRIIGASKQAEDGVLPDFLVIKNEILSFINS
jgi:pyruvate/2-oxoglutarate/acetoin dehydrogenase E1 component